MQQPKKTKFRKQHKGRNRGLSYVGSQVSHGTFGLKSTELGFLTARQIEAARKAISRLIKKTGKMWIKVFADKPITKKPLEVRQGKGKGPVEYWVARIQPGRVIFEMEGISKEEAILACRLAGAKLPLKTIFVDREIIG